MLEGRERIQLKKRGNNKIIHIYSGKKRVLIRSQIVEVKTVYSPDRYVIANSPSSSEGLN